MRSTFALAVTAAFLGAWVGAQTPAPDAATSQTVTFEAASIKKHASGTMSGGIRNLPDGTVIMVNVPVSSAIGSAYPTLHSQVVGLPAWASTERYDITVKPAAGSTREQRTLMWRAMFAERMRLKAHYETRDMPAYALVPMHDDKRFGPQLKGPITDCLTNAPRPATAAEAPLRRCSSPFESGKLASDGMLLSTLALTLSGQAGRPVVDQTGLPGLYAFTLTYTPSFGGGGDASVDAPSLFTAVEEQLGLKLRPTLAPMQVVVIDQIDRPTEN